jgi:ABC-type sugar transport system permease subunit
MISGLQRLNARLKHFSTKHGANGKQVLRHITFPLMGPVILFSAITATIGGIQIFDEPFVLTNGTGGTAQTGVTMGMYLYQTAFQEFHFGISAAMSYIIFGFILIITLINSKIFKSKT